MTRNALFVLALALAACTPTGDENAVEGPDVTEQAGDVPLQGDDNVPVPPGAPANEQASSAPPSATPQGSVTLAASPARTGAGTTVNLTLTNGSRDQIGYNLCTSGLESASGTAVQTDIICTMELRTLEPGRSATYGWDLPANLPVGRYRFSTGVENMSDGGRTVVKSNLIEVI